jgi:hypothetical protein
MRYRHSEYRSVGHGIFSLALIFGFCFLATSAWAQASMGTITGTITDPQGSVVTGAKVTIKNTQTDVTFNTTTTSSGVYSATSLNPGQYQVTVSASGFKSSVRDSVTLQVSDRLVLDFKLAVGSISETVSVTGEAPLLQTGTASLGTVIDENEISSLPVLNGNVMTLMRMTVGFVNTTGNSIDSTTPWSANNGLSNYNVNGSDGFSAQYTLDGSPNNNRENGQRGDHNASDISIVPPSDAVGEFKTQSNTYDAENGRSAGGSISISLKSGSNKWHGSLYEYFRNTIFNANSVANKVTGAERSPMHWNQPGGSISGPLIRNKLFFMFSTETDDQHITNTSQITVPDAALITAARNNDDTAIGAYTFPATLYDAGCEALRTTSFTQLQNDPCWSTIQNSDSYKLAKKLLSLMPEPNLTVSYGTANRNLNTKAFNLYHTYVGRLDYAINSSNNFAITYSHDNYKQSISNPAYSLAAASSDAKSYRYNDATTMTWTKTINPSTVATTRLNFSRHVTQSVPYAWGYDPSQIGFSGLTAYATEFPSVTLTYNGAAGGGGGAPAAGLLGNTGLGNTYDSMYTFGETLTKVIKTHSLKLGGELWLMLDNYNNPSSNSGSFTFDSTYTKEYSCVNGPPNCSSGDPAAAMLMGYPTSASVAVNTAMAYSDRYYSLYAQDDWRLLSKLTLNLGLRWDYESPETERNNKAAVGFDTTTPIMTYDYTYNNVTTPKILTGGLIYASSSKRSAFTPYWLVLQPRIGLSYQITNKLIFRGGFGLQASATSLFPSAGDFNTTSTYKATSDNGFTPDVLDNTLANPFPLGINAPTGNSNGLKSYFGQSYTILNPMHKTVTQKNFSAGIEYQLPFKTVISATYVGMRSDNSEPMDNWDANQLPWDTYAYYGTHDVNGNDVRGNSNASVLNDKVTNPFMDYIPASSSMYTSTLTNAQMLLPYPQFSGVTIQGENVVKRWYDSLQVQANKRVSNGLMLMSNFTWSKNESADHWLNGGHSDFKDMPKEIIPSDRAMVFNLAGSYSLPFYARSHGIKRQVLGGWNVSTTMSYQSGQPSSLGGGPGGGGPNSGNGFNWTGASLKTANKNYNRWFNTCSVSTTYDQNTNEPTVTRSNCASETEPVAWVINGNYDKRTTTYYLKQIRAPSIPLYTTMNMSVYKDFSILEGYKLSFRAEAYDLLNSPEYGGTGTLGSNASATSGFGVVTTTSASNDPRIMQFSLKLSF